MGKNQIKRQFTIHIAAGEYIIEQISTHTYRVRNPDEQWPLLSTTITIVPDENETIDQIHSKDAQEALKAIKGAVAEVEGTR